MIKYFVGLLMWSVSFISCSKSSGDKQQEEEIVPEYYFRCKVNDDSVSFTKDARAERINGEFNITLLGSNNTQGMGIIVSGNTLEDRIIAQDYPDSSSSFRIVGTYILNGEEQYYYAGSDQYMSAAINDIKITNPYKLVITEIDEKTIKGTFSGDHFKDGHVNGEVETISDGEFFLPFKKR